MQIHIDAIRDEKDISLETVQAIVGALFCAVKVSSGGHLKPQQVVLDSLADLTNWLQDELTAQAQQSAQELDEWRKSRLTDVCGFDESLQALQNLTIRGAA
tara:strand:+ start:527 stop:829 length:303 start_codon:yes stop_codon:yes gene_type:complete